VLVSQEEWAAASIENRFSTISEQTYMTIDNIFHDAIFVFHFSHNHYKGDMTNSKKEQKKMWRTVIIEQ
jgi:hypothetical protein